ncbi:AAA family ATPase [Bradyrhizobium sp. UFLA01-814]|uniref:AAA family ATPase n=1 Tax=Bradyrhizobium sp. UFLA01-814 TaxID=3023480 RepID=UPI00398B55F7
MGQADDIRRFVIDRYIAPARARGERRVSIRAGGVHREMELENAMPAVCSAIGSNKFAAEAGAREISRDGPANSSTVMFTFELNEEAPFSVATAEAELRTRYGALDVDSDKMASFVLPDGRAIALQRDIPRVQLWLEDDERTAPAAEQRLYEPNQGRHSNLPNRLKHEPNQEFRGLGYPKRVRSVRLESVSQLRDVLRWYENQAGKADNENIETNGGEQPVPQLEATNLILYGPPGTGKTYATAEEAVALCDGKLPEGSNRQEVMARFNALKEAGRIAFVTFHQSYSYEEFVEGLRPETDPEDGEQAVSAGFRLKPKDGIFKRISTLAQQASYARSSTVQLGHPNYFKMSLGVANEDDDVYREAIEKGYIALGWGGDIDWSDPSYEDFNAILEKWRAIKPGISSHGGDVVQTFCLRNVMKIGDIVIISYGNGQFRAVGQVTGPYEFAADASQYRHRRKVRWLRVLDRPLPVESILTAKFGRQALYKIDEKKVNRAALENVLSEQGKPEPGHPGQALVPYVLIIDEINRANISKVFGELITLIEPDKRVGTTNGLTVTLPYSGEAFGVPANLHIIGTMNTADRSIALLDTALRRRFRFKELMPNPALLSDKIEGIDLGVVLSRLNERIEYLFDREHQIGHAYFMGCNTREKLDLVMRDKVIPLLAEYFYDDWEKVRLVLGESSDQGSFIDRTRLPRPGTISDEDGLDRFRYTIRSTFAGNAYDGLR